MMSNTRKTLLALLVASTFMAAACGSPTPATETSEPAAAPTVTAESTTEPVATDVPEPTAEQPSSPPQPEDPGPDFGRIVVLAEEYLLADVLALGIQPVASASTVETVGFQGVDEFDTEAIEVLPMLTLSLERLAALQADTLITIQWVANQTGEDILAGMADNLIIIPDGLSVSDRMMALGEALDRTDEAHELIQQLTKQISSASETLGGDCGVTVIAIYSGPSVALFLEPIWEVPRTIVDLGCTLIPGPDAASTDQNGRAYLSLEQLGLLEGPEIIMLQTSTVEGEQAGIAEIADMALWQQLPAVVAGEVTEFDRLGYPGVAGQMRFIDDFVAAMTN